MRHTIVVILAAAAALLAVFAFREAHASRQARTVLATALDERDGLRARLAKLEQEQQTLAAENATLRHAAAVAAARPPPDTAPQVLPFSTAALRGRMPRPMNVFDTPAVRQLIAIEQKARLDDRYAPLFKALRLDPVKLDQLKQLLVDKQNAPTDVIAAAHNHELLDPGTGYEIHQLVQNETSAVDAAIHELLGPTAFEEYQDFERTTAQRGVVDQLASRLSYTDSPLSPLQIEALVDLLAAERATMPAPATTPTTTAGMHVAIATSSGNAMVNLVTAAPGEGAPISSASLAGAQTVLSASQLAALRQLQGEQRAQRRMSELLRRSMPMPALAPAQGATWSPASAAPAAPPP